MAVDDDDLTSSVDRPIVLGELPPEELPPGTQVGEYVVEGTLGAGGCARVYSARQPIIDRRVAIKVLHQELSGSAQMVQRFVREARIVNKIKNPHIVDIYGFGAFADGRPYFVMELLQGRNLGAVVKSRGRLSPGEAAEYLAPIVDALAAAHAIGVVHRDLKSSNVLVTDEKLPPVVKLLDFGIAKLLHPEPGEVALTTEQQRLGSYSSMAPEQILGAEIDPRTDVYALGVLLFFMVTGRNPFNGKDAMAFEYAHLNQPPPRPSELSPVSPGVDAVVLKALAKHKEDRYASAGEFLLALKEGLAPAEAPRRTTSSEKALRVAQGVAIYVQLRPDAGREDDESLLEAAAVVMEPIEQELAAGKFKLMLQTGSALIGARVLSDDLNESRGIAREAITVAQRVFELGRSLAPPGLKCSVLVHVDDVELKLTASGVTPSGGHLLRVDDWPITAEDGWYASHEALALCREDIGLPPR